VRVPTGGIQKKSLARNANRAAIKPDPSLPNAELAAAARTNSRKGGTELTANTMAITPVASAIARRANP
jgi:hypothetical protein